MDDSVQIGEFLESLDISVANLAAALKPVLATPLEEHIANLELPKEKIQVYHSHLYTLVSLAFASLKTQGVKTENHPIMRELQRIQGSMKKLKDIEASAAKKESEETEKQEKANEYLKQTLGTSGGQAAPDSMKSPAISSANFKGKHAKFKDEAATSTEQSTASSNTKASSKDSVPTKTTKNTQKSTPAKPASSKGRQNAKKANKVTKPKKK